ncbi:hypothetical protein B0T24DRAFT_65653 [Lasiosphaeria ovina]|uniref:Uncharacterized protein n=1 Tax=Lasiosphaeria ovina TaxID=92902 RepID=A0AAE0NLV3_9PEZI|nr:hypothetical protein B0T24DRAFT_65653 [Lasiosphaeria ovina]
MKPSRYHAPESDSSILPGSQNQNHHHHRRSGRDPGGDGHAHDARTRGNQSTGRRHPRSGLEPQAHPDQAKDELVQSWLSRTQPRHPRFPEDDGIETLQHFSPRARPETKSQEKRKRRRSSSRGGSASPEKRSRPEASFEKRARHKTREDKYIQKLDAGPKKSDVRKRAVENDRREKVTINDRLSRRQSSNIGNFRAGGNEGVSQASNHGSDIVASGSSVVNGGRKPSAPKGKNHKILTSEQERDLEEIRAFFSGNASKEKQNAAGGRERTQIRHAHGTGDRGNPHQISRGRSRRDHVSGHDPQLPKRGGQITGQREHGFRQSGPGQAPEVRGHQNTPRDRPSSNTTACFTWSTTDTNLETGANHGDLFSEVTTTNDHTPESERGAFGEGSVGSARYKRSRRHALGLSHRPERHGGYRDAASQTDPYTKALPSPGVETNDPRVKGQRFSASGGCDTANPPVSGLVQEDQIPGTHVSYRVTNAELLQPDQIQTQPEFSTTQGLGTLSTTVSNEASYGLQPRQDIQRDRYADMQLLQWTEPASGEPLFHRQESTRNAVPEELRPAFTRRPIHAGDRSLGQAGDTILEYQSGLDAQLLFRPARHISVPFQGNQHGAALFTNQFAPAPAMARQKPVLERMEDYIERIERETLGTAAQQEERVPGESIVTLASWMRQ